MAGVKGSAAYNNNKGFGVPFYYPTKVKSTTEAFINEFIWPSKEIITGRASNATDTEIGNDSMNTTAIDEGIQSNITSVVNNTTSILNNTLDGTATEAIQNSSETITDAINIITDKTESTMETITTTLMDLVPNSKNEDNSTFTEHDMYTHPHNTSYIIMGVLIGILILTAISLAAFYIFYKKKNTAQINSKYSQRASQEIASNNLRDLNQTVITQQSAC